MKVQSSKFEVRSYREQRVFAQSWTLEAGRRNQRSGVALIITLIMLSVITFLAVAFLALSRREVASSIASRTQTDAKLASDTALARAMAETMAKILASTNPYNYDLMVSRNYINPNGFDPNISGLDTNNVNYDFKSGGTPLTPDEMMQNIANLFFDPRPPVFIKTNGLGDREFRFYLDFNRNRRFETNGLGPELLEDQSFKIGPVTNIVGTTTNVVNVVLTNSWVGDPEWVGVLQKPEFPHSGTNYFTARYAFLAQPVGKTLDANFAYNHAKSTFTGAANMSSGNRPIDRYLRNEGVGSWELNLAAFIYDWNRTNYDNTRSNSYDYITGSSFPTEDANQDASAFIRYRYASNIVNFPSAANTLSVNGAGFTVAGTRLLNIFTNDFIDNYANGPVLVTTNNLNVENTAQFDDTSKAWPGSRNPNAFKDLQEFFDPNKLSTNWVNRLTNSSGHTNFYERYSYYRLLTQLGVDSHTNDTFSANGETYRKVNLNYDNFTPTNYLSDPRTWNASPTNFLEWSPSNFFFHAADALIKRSLVRVDATNWFLSDTNWQKWTNGRPNITSDPNWYGTNVLASPYWVGTNFSLTNIQIYPPRTNSPYNQYSSALHRLLQMAANIYGATTNGFATNVGGNAVNMPYVFRPYFRRENSTNIFIAGYEEETSSTNIGPFYELAGFANQTTNVAVELHGVNFYGVPWIVSAKKGWPNFNEVSLETVFQMTRKLELRKRDTNYSTIPSQINSMYLVGITNYVGLEFWNSYLYTNPRQFRVLFTNQYTGVLKDTNGTIIPFKYDNSPATPVSNPLAQKISNLPSAILANWPGASNKLQQANPASFYVPASNRVDFLPLAQYVNNNNAPYFQLVPTNFIYSSFTNTFEINQCYTPNWQLEVTNRLFCAIEDVQSRRLIDFVSLEGPTLMTNITDAASTTNLPSVPLLGERPRGGSVADIRELFDREDSSIYFTNFCSTIPEGVSKQMRISLGELGSNLLWDDPKKGIEIERFKKFYGDLGSNGVAIAAVDRMQAPYSPTITLYFKKSWQANDPLVHYIPSDLWSEYSPFEPKIIGPPTKPYSQFSESNVGKLNERYSPWGGKQVPGQNPLQNQESSPESLYNMGMKDPLVRKSEDWDFPTNKFPNIGWIGRVHRGTPWQTIYLKSAVVDSNLWENWTGGTLITNVNSSGEVITKWVGGNPQSHPTNDWYLLDAFTTAQNDNAIRGLLSVNQTNFAAWSAVFSAVQALTNREMLPGSAPTLTFEDFEILPGSPQLTNLFDSISAARNQRPNKVFQSVGEILAADALTMSSPFLLFTNKNDNADDANQMKYGLPDSVLERLAQLILSLVQTDQPRIAIYAYGQSLKPAENSIVVRAPRAELQNLCTNYQVTGEVVARAIVRFDPKIEWFSDPLPNGTFARTNYHAVIENYRILREE